MSVTLARQIVLRNADGSNIKTTIVRPMTAIVRVPVLMRGGFGARDYAWDGRETNVMGLPVYREEVRFWEQSA